jgi:hypothetical protein
VPDMGPNREGERGRHGVTLPVPGDRGARVRSEE